jgi:propionyl-CoA carboxylase beta chain
MTDFIFMVRDTSYMFVTGPDVVKTVTGEVVTAEELGGARTHSSKSSVADGAYENDVETLAEIRRLVDLLPLSNRDEVPEWPFFDPSDRPDSCPAPGRSTAASSSTAPSYCSPTARRRCRR